MALPPPPPAPATTAPSAGLPPPPPPVTAAPVAAPPPPPPPVVAAPVVEAPPLPPTVAEVPPPPAAAAQEPVAPPSPPVQAAPELVAPPSPPAQEAAPVVAPPAAVADLPVPVTEAQLPVVSQPAGLPAVAAPSGGGGSVLAAQAEEEGLYGLKFGIGAFPFVSLDQGRFRTSDKEDLGTAFWFRVTGGARPKYLYRTALDDRDPRNELAYSYDRTTDISGESIKDLLEKWAKAGIAYEVKEYLEITATLQSDAIVLLSIPDSSNPRFAACFAKIKQRGAKLSETWILAGIGEQIVPKKSGKPFYPWKFSLQGE